MQALRRPRIVVTIHGIRTRGRWQKEITPYLAEHGLVPYHVDYGWFPALKFLLPWTREKQLEATRTELRSLLDKVKTRRVSIIAHSFGTWLAMECLRRENGNILFDRIVLTGCILPTDFDWSELISDKKWVMAVRNERATDDWAVSLARLASRRWVQVLFRLHAGDSGRSPFDQALPTLLDDFVVGGHSESHNPLKYEEWARFSAYPLLPDDVLDSLRTEMDALRHEAAAVLGLEAELLRANFFAPFGASLRIVPGACDNMLYAPELDLEIQPGHGSTGTAYSSGNPCILVKRGNDWSGRHLPGTELAKVNPRLRWAVSLPVKSEAQAAVLGVLNIDGLDNVPPILQDEQKSQAFVLLMLAFMRRIEPYLEAAFRGEKFAPIS